MLLYSCREASGYDGRAPLVGSMLGLCDLAAIHNLPSPGVLCQCYYCRAVPDRSIHFVTFLPLFIAARYGRSFLWTSNGVNTVHIKGIRGGENRRVGWGKHGGGGGVAPSVVSADAANNMEEERGGPTGPGADRKDLK